MRIHLTKGVRDLSSMQDQQHFDECLLNWYLDKASRFGTHNLLVCVAGGYKTMSASLQKAASLFGARCVFHVLSGSHRESIPPEACTGPGLRDGKINGPVFPQCNLNAIRHWAKAGSLFPPIVGPETGWSSFRQLSVSPAYKEHSGETQSYLQADPFHPQSLSQVIRKTQASVQRAARAFSLQENTFAALGGWDESAYQKLEDKVAKHSRPDFIRKIPKIELHCHLGGFATHGSLRQEVIKKASHLHLKDFPAEVAYPDNWPTPKSPINLQDYMRLGDGNGSGVLKDPGCLKQHCELLYQSLCDDGVVYAEIRCSPQNYAFADLQRGAWEVLCDIRKTFESAMKASREKDGDFCQINLIIIATRKEGGDLSSIARHLGLAVTAADPMKNTLNEGAPTCRVVGVDLAGFESRETRAAYFARDFGLVHRCGLAVTAHAGENDDAEGIWQAVYDLHARRLGHALQLQQAPDLLRTVTERQIAVELCPYANFQIKGFQPMLSDNSTYPVYPFRNYLKAGVRVTVNTDNPSISGASLSDNLIFLATLDPSLTYTDLFRLQRNALEAAFISPNEREILRDKINERIESLYLFTS